MGLSFAFTLALIIWIVVWALGAKGMDAFLLAAVFSFVAIATAVVSKYLPGNRPQR